MYEGPELDPYLSRNCVPFSKVELNRFGYHLLIVQCDRQIQIYQRSMPLFGDAMRRQVSGRMWETIWQFKGGINEHNIVSFFHNSSVVYFDAISTSQLVCSLRGHVSRLNAVFLRGLLEYVTTGNYRERRCCGVSMELVCGISETI